MTNEPFQKLKCVGYWSTDSNALINTPDLLPDPADLASYVSSYVCPLEPDENKVMNYLGSGVTFVHWRGLSWCRICNNEFNGSKCLTDGTWIWPEGLSHYISEHSLQLPGEFVEHMKSNEWTIPISSISRPRNVSECYDFSFWLKWSRQAMVHKENP